MKTLALLLLLSASALGQAGSGIYEIKPQANVVGGHGVLIADNLALYTSGDPAKRQIGAIARIDSLRSCGPDPGLVYLQVQNINYGCVDSNTAYYEAGSKTVGTCSGAAYGIQQYWNRYVTITVIVVFTYQRLGTGCYPGIADGFVSVTTP